MSRVLRFDDLSGTISQWPLRLGPPGGQLLNDDDTLTVTFAGQTWQTACVACSGSRRYISGSPASMTASQSTLIDGASACAASWRGSSTSPNFQEGCPGAAINGSWAKISGIYRPANGHKLIIEGGIKEAVLVTIFTHFFYAEIDPMTLRTDTGVVVNNEITSAACFTPASGYTLASNNVIGWSGTATITLDPC